jgi:hypothetical protein
MTADPAVFGPPQPPRPPCCRKCRVWRGLPAEPAVRRRPPLRGLARLRPRRRDPSDR